MNIDSPQTTVLRRKIIQQKPFLWRIYDEWYRMIRKSLTGIQGPILELGSGAGFLDQYLPGLVSSEIFYCSDIHVVLDGQQLPFEDHSLSAIVMVDVFHHLPEARRFFAEASRCVPKGGVISMIEPWYSRWSQFIIKRLHHEPMDPNAKIWGFTSGGPLSGANQALPWIIFQRDVEKFKDEFPAWQIERVKLFMPFRYVISGGISTRNLAPNWSFGFLKALEQRFFEKHANWAMFAHIVLRRV